MARQNILNKKNVKWIILIAIITIVALSSYMNKVGYEKTVSESGMMKVILYDKDGEVIKPSPSLFAIVASTSGVYGIGFIITVAADVGSVNLYDLVVTTATHNHPSAPVTIFSDSLPPGLQTASASPVSNAVWTGSSMGISQFIGGVGNSVTYSVTVDGKWVDGTGTEQAYADGDSLAVSIVADDCLDGTPAGTCSATKPQFCEVQPPFVAVAETMSDISSISYEGIADQTQGGGCSSTGYVAFAAFAGANNKLGEIKRGCGFIDAGAQPEATLNIRIFDSSGGGIMNIVAGDYLRIWEGGTDTKVYLPNDGGGTLDLWVDSYGSTYYDSGLTLLAYASPSSPAGAETLLVDKATVCGCPVGYEQIPLDLDSCQSMQCADGTLINQCTSSPPDYCDATKTIISSCGPPGNCGCPDDYYGNSRPCEGPGTCGFNAYSGSFTVSLS